MKTLQIVLLIAVIPALGAAIEVRQKGENMSIEDISASEQLDLADSVFQSRDYEKALSAYEKVVPLAEKEFNRPVEAEALCQVARMNLILNKKEDGRIWLEKAKAKVSESEPMGWSRYLGVRGRFEWKDKDLSSAKTTFEDMYTYCNTNGLFSRAVDAAHMIAIVADNPEEQIRWGYRGIEAAEAGGVESWMGPLWNNLAGTYYDLKQYDSALECYVKARDYHWRFSDETSKLFADYHIGMTYRLLDKLDEAESWLRPVLAWAQRLENHSAAGQALEDLAEIQATKGNKTKSLQMFNEALDEYKAAGFESSWPELIENIRKKIENLNQ